MVRSLRSGELASVLPPGGSTLVSSCSAESDLLAAEVRAAGDALGAMDFSGIFVPGLNCHDWQAGAESRITSFFQTPELRKQPERSRFLPLCYQDILRLYRQQKPQAALFMCAPPDGDGFCSFGPEVAFIAALWPEIPVRIAHINPAMPRTKGDTGIPFAELTAFFEGDQILRGMAPAPADSVTSAIAAHVASLVPNGATIQTGLGKLPDAVLMALCDHRGLRLHSGLVGDGILSLLDSGALAHGDGAHGDGAHGGAALVGVAIGSQALYDRLDDPHFQFRPVTTTHDPDILASIDRLVTINSAMEVDLYGQVFAEASSRGFQSGPGGASDFARGARRSNGGLRIIALPAQSGAIDRIVAPGTGHGPVSLSRFDVDFVVSEYGIADLRLQDYHHRAAALIAIAAPSHRDELAQSWATLAKHI
jgi:acyl-CoA hydrolase